MTSRAFYTAGALAFLIGSVYLLVRLGAAGWFTLTIALVFVGVTVAFLWPAIVAATIGFVLFRFARWRSRRKGARRWD